MGETVKPVLQITDREEHGCIRVHLWAGEGIVGDPITVCVPREELHRITAENLLNLATDHNWEHWLG